MKKIISIFWVLFIIVASCACVNTDMPSETTYNGVSDVTTETIVTTVNTTSDIVSTTSPDNTAATTTATTTVATTVQTDSAEEKAMKARYEAVKANLAEYLDKGSFYIDEEYKGNVALEYLYNEFKALGDYQDSKDYSERFTVLPNMLTSITAKSTNPLGEVVETLYASYIYDAKGNLKNNHGPIDLTILGFDETSAAYANEYLQYEFDDSGKLVLANLIVREKTIAVITPEYDEKGNIIKVITKGDNTTFTQLYEYDDQNRLVKKSKTQYYFDEYTNISRAGYSLSYTYSYDEKGRLVEETQMQTNAWFPIGQTPTPAKTIYRYNDMGKLIEKAYSYKSPTTYSYDENGNLIKESYRSNDKEYFYDENCYLIKETEIVGEKFYERVYVNDEEGRHISAEITATQNGEQISNPQTLTYNYETLYFYNAK